MVLGEFGEGQSKTLPVKKEWGGGGGEFFKNFLGGGLNFMHE